MHAHQHENSGPVQGSVFGFIGTYLVAPIVVFILSHVAAVVWSSSLRTG